MLAPYHALLAPAAAAHIDPRWIVGLAGVAAIVAGPVVGTSTALCLATLAAAIERRQSAMVVCYAMAVACSAHALMMAPLMAALMFHRHVGRCSGNATLLAVGMALIAVLRMGVPAVDAPLPQLNAGAPTVWSIVALLPVDTPLIGLALASLIGAAAMLTAHYAVQPLGHGKMVTAAAVTSLVIAVLLPGADTDWFVLPTAIISLRALWWRRPRNGLAAAAVIAGYALAASGMSAAGAAAMIAATMLLAAPPLRFAANDNGVWPHLANSGTDWVMRSLR